MGTITVTVRGELATTLAEKRRQLAMTTTEMWAAAHLSARGELTRIFGEPEWAMSEYAVPRQRRIGLGGSSPLKLMLTPTLRQNLLDEANAAGTTSVSAFVEEIFWHWLTTVHQVSRPS